MSIKRNEGIVLRSLKLGETSKILHLYTRESGLLKLVAKGARKSPSKLGGSVEPLYTIEAVYYEKENRELQVLSQASILEAPRNVFKEADRLLLGMACCEMVSRLETTGSGNPKVYGLLRASIRALDEVTLEPRHIFFAFQLRFLQLLGVSPGIDRCCACGSKRTEAMGYVYSEAKLYCPDCFQGAVALKPMEANLLVALRQLERLPLSAVGKLGLPANILLGLYDFLTAFYRYHLEELGTLKSIEVLKQMKRLEAESAPGNKTG